MRQPPPPDLVAALPRGAQRSLTAKKAETLLRKVRPRDEVGRRRRRLVVEQVADLVTLDKKLAALEVEIRAAVK